MFLNDAKLKPSAALASRQPLLRVMCDGHIISTALRASVRQVAHFHADTFEAEFSLDNKFYPLAWWSSTLPILLDVQVGFSSNGAVSWQSLITGQVDHVQAQLGNRTLHVEGRDLSARLIDLQIQASYPNKTASEIATTLAAQVGLQADVAPTTTLVGKYYQGDHDTITNGQFSRQTRAWDLLTNLAQRERYDVWVTGTTLHFRPQVASDPTPWLVRYTQPTLSAPTSTGSAMSTNDLSLQRSLTLAKDIVVVVLGWSSATGKQVKASYPQTSSATLHAPNSNLVQKVFNVANLKDHAEALQLAQSYYADITRNERIVEWREPGDLTLTTRNMVQLQGTGSDWDQTYYVDSISREIGFDSGFTMQVRAKNQSPQTETVVG